MERSLPPPDDPVAPSPRTNVILIDFENVQPASLHLLRGEQYRVVVFVGAQQRAIPFEVADALQSLGARAEYIRICASGPNALDLHLAFHAGRLVEADPGVFLHIISKDKGFDPLLQHLGGTGVLVRRSESIADLPTVRRANLRTTSERAAFYLEKLRRPKATRPRKEATLRSSIRAEFNGSISGDEVLALVEALKASGFLEVRDGKVIYAEAPGGPTGSCGRVEAPPNSSGTHG